jgi:cytochrome c553
VKKILKWLGFVVVGLVALMILAMAYVHVAFKREMARQYQVAETLSVSLPTDAAEIEEGHRLAHITGCTHCHGDDLAGGPPIDIPPLASFVPPNITSIVPEMSDAALVALLRRGVKRDGTGVWLMPSEMYRHLHDQDLARIIAWVRSVPQSNRDAGKTQVHFMGRMVVALDQFKSGARQIEEAAGDPPIPAGRGAYLVMNACSECHGQDLNGLPQAKSPSLVLVKGYSAEQFARLMQVGVGTGEREFELMTPTAKARFSHLTPDEVQAVYDFLRSRFEKTPETAGG